MPKPFTYPLIPPFLALIATPALAQSTADIDAQYHSVLAALAKPAVSGILVTEVAPDSSAAQKAAAGGTGGLRGGDIITHYYNTRVTTLQALRQQVADAIAAKLNDPSSGASVVVQVRRGSEDKFLQLPREPLDIRAVAVEASVPGPRNPPPSARGEISLNWNAVAAAVQADAGAALRTLERADSAAGPEEEWIGWQTCKIVIESDELAGALEWHRVIDTPEPKSGELTAPPVPRTEKTTLQFHLSLGDQATRPAFVLTDVDARYSADRGTLINAAAERLGERLKASFTFTAPASNPVKFASESPAPLNTIPQPALPWVAAALPHEKDKGLGLYLLSLRDLQSRPGYVLVTRGKQPMPADLAPVPATTAAVAPATAAQTQAAWQVDLLHVGLLVETYWFSDQSSLLCMQSHGAQSVISRRTATLADASLPMQRKPVTGASKP